MSTLYIIKFGEDDYLVSRNINNVNIVRLFELKNVPEIEITEIQVDQIQEDANNNVIIDGKTLGYIDKQLPELILTIQSSDQLNLIMDSIRTITASIEDLQSKQSSLSEIIAQLQNQDSELIAADEQLQNTCNQLSESVEEIENSLTTTISSVGELNNSVLSLHNRQDRVTELVSKHIMDSEERFNTLENRKTILITPDQQKDIVSIASNLEEGDTIIVVSDTQENLEELNNYIRQLNSTVSNLTSSVETIKTGVNNHIVDSEERFNAIEDKKTVTITEDQQDNIVSLASDMEDGDLVKVNRNYDRIIDDQQIKFRRRQESQARRILHSV